MLQAGSLSRNVCWTCLNVSNSSLVRAGVTNEFMLAFRTHRSSRVFVDVWCAGHYLHWRVFGCRKHRHGRPCSSRLFNEQHIMHWYSLVIDAETAQTHIG